MEKLYNFEDDGKICRILNTNIPRHWYNYLWNDNGYCTQVSEIGHGKSYYIDNKANMCSINGNSARYVYIRDDDTGDVFNIGSGPVNTPVENYSCINHIGYTEISSRYKGIEASHRIFVPEHGFNEVWTITLKNTERVSKSISMFSVVSFDLSGFSHPRYYEMYRCIETSFVKELNGIYCKQNHPFAPHNRYNGFITSSEPVFGYDGDLRNFCGVKQTLTNDDASVTPLFSCPELVMSGKDCTNSDAALFIVGGVLQHKLVLLPGESKTIHIAVGVAENSDEAINVHRQLLDKKKIEILFEQTVKYNLDKYKSLCAKTPDEKINNIMNYWLKKQVDFCIVGKKGVRDNLQIAVSLLQFRPEKAKLEILECLAHQFKDGHGVLTWYPYDDTRYSDQPFWIIWSVCELIKEFGDYSLLEQEIPWQDGGKDTVKSHLKAAVKCLQTNKGPNGLCKIMYADWNDALNVTTDPDAESVMLSEQFALALRELIELFEKTGDKEYVALLKSERKSIVDCINKSAYDGDRYMRALSKNENIGSHSSTGSKIYLNSQTWAILGDVVDKDKLEDVKKSIDSMEHDFGFPLNLPAYEQYNPNVGRMSGMLPGEFENGGVYCHATGFKILADCKLGWGSEALRTLKKIMPDSDKNPSFVSGAEPYVFTNCYSTHPKYYGRSYQSWTTGTSAWAQMCLYEGILGVKRNYDGLKIQPAFPSDWEFAEMTRTFRGTDYHFEFSNPDHLENGNLQIVADGKALDGNILTDYNDGKIHEIKISFKK